MLQIESSWVACFAAEWRSELGMKAGSARQCTTQRLDLKLTRASWAGQRKS